MTNEEMKPSSPSPNPGQQQLDRVGLHGDREKRKEKDCKERDSYIYSTNVC